VQSRAVLGTTWPGWRREIALCAKQPEFRLGLLDVATKVRDMCPRFIFVWREAIVSQLKRDGEFALDIVDDRHVYDARVFPSRGKLGAAYQRLRRRSSVRYRDCAAWYRCSPFGDRRSRANRGGYEFVPRPLLLFQCLAESVVTRVALLLTPFNVAFRRRSGVQWCDQLRDGSLPRFPCCTEYYKARKRESVIVCHPVQRHRG
jgi:hypothetical protein